MVRSGCSRSFTQMLFPIGSSRGVWSDSAHPQLHNAHQSQRSPLASRSDSYSVVRVMHRHRAPCRTFRSLRFGACICQYRSCDQDLEAKRRTETRRVRASQSSVVLSTATSESDGCTSAVKYTRRLSETFDSHCREHPKMQCIAVHLKQRTRSNS